MTEIVCQNLSHRYNHSAVLDGVDLTLQSGQMSVVLGSSGSGKTTLLRLIAGFEAPEHGTIQIGSIIVTREHRIVYPPERRSVGYVPQEGALFPHLTVAQNIGFGLPRAERTDQGRLTELIETVGLSADFLGRHPEELSGGEQRRVAVARALAPRPQFIVLDEPFSGLDANLRYETRLAVRDALAGVGTGALLVTHDQGEALSIGAMVAVLRGGKIVQSGTPVELYRAPVDLETARFVGDSSVLVGVRQDSGTTVSCALGELPVAGGTAATGNVHVLVRPEQLLIGPNRSTLHTAVVTRITFFGSISIAELKMTQGSGEVVKARMEQGSTLADGDIVSLEVRGNVLCYQQ